MFLCVVLLVSSVCDVFTLCNLRILCVLMKNATVLNLYFYSLCFEFVRKKCQESSFVC